MSPAAVDETAMPAEEARPPTEESAMRRYPVPTRTGGACR